jgi:hypothetical protein
MKTQRHLLPVTGSILVLLIVMISCSPARKSAVSCTEFPVYKSSRINHQPGNNKWFSVRHRTAGTNYHASSGKKQNKNLAVIEPVKDVIGRSSINNKDKIEFSKGLTASTDNNILALRNNADLNEKVQSVYTGQSYDLLSPQVSKCDTIILKSGSVIYAKVEEISQTEIKFRKCNNLTGPLNTISKAEVSSIRYINGTRDNFNPVEEPTYQAYVNPQNNIPPQAEGLSVVGFIASIIGLFIASIPLGLLAIIFGATGLKKIRRNPARYKGRGLAIASIAIGVVDVVVMIILLATM